MGVRRLKSGEVLEMAKNKMISAKITYDPAHVSALSDLLLDVYHSVRPKPDDYEHRKRSFQMLNTLANDILGSSNGFPILRVLGSVVMGLFITTSDLDLSINFSNDHATDFPNSKKISVLRKFAKALYKHQRKGLVSGVLPLVNARVPTLKLVDCQTGIGCDITVENKDGISRSLILKIISSMDGRFRILGYLMKAWAKAQGINSSQHRSLNSLSLMSLTVVHLQTRDPPIFPPFSALMKDGVDLSSIQKTVFEFQYFGRRNKESVSELFDALLRNLALLENFWQHGLCASAFEGSWISKKWESGVAYISVEDFLDRTQNCARTVGKSGMQKIYRSIWSSLYHLARFMEGQIEASELKGLLFGYIPPSEGIDLKRGRSIDGSADETIKPITKKMARRSETKESSSSTH